MQKAKWVKIKDYWDDRLVDGYAIQTYTPKGQSTLLTFFPFESYDGKEKIEENKGYTCYVTSMFNEFDTWESEIVPIFFKSIEEAEKYYYSELVDYCKAEVQKYENALNMLV